MWKNVGHFQVAKRLRIVFKQSAIIVSSALAVCPEPRFGFDLIKPTCDNTAVAVANKTSTAES